jgi:hypothetical protein
VQVLEQNIFAVITSRLVFNLFKYLLSVSYVNSAFKFSNFVTMARNLMAFMVFY